MHDGGLPACPTSTQPRECEIAKTLINIMKNNPKRHVHYTIIKIDLAWTTNTIIVDDFCALCLTHCAGLIFDVSGIFFADLRFEVGWRREKYFLAIQLCTFWLDFACVPASSSNLFGVLASLFFIAPPLLAQLGGRFWNWFVCISASSSNLNNGFTPSRLVMLNGWVGWVVSGDLDNFLPIQP